MSDSSADETCTEEATSPARDTSASFTENIIDRDYALQRLDEEAVAAVLCSTPQGMRFVVITLKWTVGLRAVQKSVESRYRSATRLSRTAHEEDKEWVVTRGSYETFLRRYLLSLPRKYVLT